MKIEVKTAVIYDLMNKTCCMVDWKGAFALYFRPHRWAFDSSSATAPGNLPSIRKKKGKFVGLARGGAGRSWN